MFCGVIQCSNIYKTPFRYIVAMGKYIDFIIDYNEDPKIMGEHILQNITVNRLKAKKPCIIFIGGDSGEGKSCMGLKIVDAVNKKYDIDTLDTLNDSVVYLPVEYLTKLDNCLHWKQCGRKDLKDLHVMMIDEAREVVRARDWYTFINRAIADCNAMSRRIKPMVLIVISQFIKDIDSAIRYTLTYYAECQRPLSGRTRVNLERVWKNTYDLERPRLCKRPLRGYIRSDNTMSKFYPKFEANMPNRKIFNKYDEENFNAKSKILRKRIEETINKMKKQVDIFDKVQALVDYYFKNPDQLTTIIDPRYKKFRLRKNFKDMHEITSIEQKEFEKRLEEKLKEKGMIAGDDI